MRRFAVALLVAPFLAACSSAAPKPIKAYSEATPIRVSGGSKTIAVKRVTSTLDKGHAMGVIQGGLLCVGQQPLQWAQAGQLAPGAEQRYAGVIRDELSHAGYSVIGATAAVSGVALFEDQPAADFLLAAVVKEVSWNTCYPHSGLGSLVESSGEASIEIEWHLYDTEAKSILFTTTTGGSFKTERQVGGAAYALTGAIAAATRALLADEQFAFYLASSPRQSTRP